MRIECLQQFSMLLYSQTELSVQIALQEKKQETWSTHLQ